MKSLKYLLISLFATLYIGEAHACWFDWYYVDEYYMYRVYDTNPEPYIHVEGCYPGAGNNCKSWQKLTSDTIPLEDIYKVVYSMSLEEFEKMYDNRNATYENKFAEWITKKDTAILDFLYVAKNNEYLRVKRNSRWYYPTMKIGAKMTIEDIANKSLAATDTRLRDRYLLQAVRALFSMQRYQECIDIWEKEASKLPLNNLMRKMIQPYIAGAEFRTNNSEKALKYFAQIGDIESILFCTGRSGKKLSTIDALKLVCEHDPNSPHILEMLHKYVRSLEPGSTPNVYGGGYIELREQEIDEFSDKLLPFCLEMAKRDKVENPAMWYYTAAVLSDVTGDANKANDYLKLAEKAKPSKYIDESIKVFRIYLDAKLSTYDSAYEAKLFEQLKWLDSQIKNNIDDDVRSNTALGYDLNSGISYYYWNDMLRRIVLAEVCPRMIKAGKITRALQLANMADNLLLSLVNRRALCYYERINEEYVRIEKSCTMSEYRYDGELFNIHDYSNNFFEMADSLGANTVKRYVQNVGAPKSEFDRFLNKRGYTGSDYLNDIVGTQLVREMRYGEAAKYLAKVSDEYNQSHLNVYMEYNPFSINLDSKKTKSNTRYEFARKMNELEQKINTSTDPNEKAQLMFRFATGLRNSFDECWPLTHYYKGCMYWGSVCEKRAWERDKYTTAAIKRSKQMVAEACKIATDKEVLANIHYELCNFKTIAKQFPNTEKGKLVRGKCDKLYDYHVGSKYPAAGYYATDGYTW